MRHALGFVTLAFIASFLTSCGSGVSSQRARELKRLGYVAVPLEAALGRDSRVGVAAAVNRERVSLLIDSGANASRISESKAASSGLKIRKDTHAISRGALGRAFKIKQGVGSLSIGDLTVEPYQFSIGDGTDGPTAIGRFDGHIGSDGLNLMSAMVDVSSNRIWLPSDRAVNVRNGIIRRLGLRPALGIVARPFSLARGSDHYILSSTANGRRVTWVIDTGAEISLLTKAAASRIGLSVQGSNVSILDAHGDRASIGLTTIPELRFGPFVAEGLQTGVGDFPSLGRFFRDRTGRPVDGILGIDFLRQASALIDAKSQILYIGSR